MNKTVYFWNALMGNCYYTGERAREQAERDRMEYLLKRIKCSQIMALNG